MAKSRNPEGKEAVPTASFEFEPFGRLPAEIRTSIWSAAASLPICTPGVCFFAERDKASEEEPRLLVQEPRNKALLETNTEARDVALMSGGPTRTYDPDRDILYISEDQIAFKHFINGPEWVTKIRHLAIAFSWTTWGLHISIAMRRLHSLETLSIVWPDSSGTFDFRASVELPADKSAPLRRLTEEELRGLTIEADFMSSTSTGDFQVQWSESGLENMKRVEEQMDVYCSPEETGDHLSPLWDSGANRLRLRYEGRHFQPVPAQAKFQSLR
ncbi:uncharacterized protein B0H64DRAFT_142456 [Chaetomium fimeti]|uniref:2EXR domain-containing protein n=1 Tax=Chaetomium fimeti TaxID=1854472 RepID=A0AAE0HEZ7_9PEZI|nr:hypothetical protein B0H64DRAFT_142456 [Chaetomium fimeti]